MLLSYPENALSTLYKKEAVVAPFFIIFKN